MNRVKNSHSFKIISLTLIITFLAFDISYAYPSEHSAQNSTLAIPSVLQQSPVNEEAARLQKLVFSQGAIAASISAIGDYIFGNADKGIGPEPPSHAIEAITADLNEHLKDTGIEILNIVPVERIEKRVSQKLKTVLKAIGFKGTLPDEDVVFALYRKNGKRFLVQIAKKDRISAENLPGYEWAPSDKYLVKYIPESYTGPVEQEKRDDKRPVISGKLKILCACNSNYNRSPAAEMVIDHLIATSGLKKEISVSSGAVKTENQQGWGQVNKRLIEAFTAQFGVSPFISVSSKTLTDKQVTESDIIIVPIAKAKEALEERFGGKVKGKKIIVLDDIGRGMEITHLDDSKTEDADTLFRTRQIIEKAVWPDVIKAGFIEEEIDALAGQGQGLGREDDVRAADAGTERYSASGAREMLKKFGQGQLLAGFEDLNAEDQQRLLAEIEEIDWEDFTRAYQMASAGVGKPAVDLAKIKPSIPILLETDSESVAAAAEGRRILSEGASSDAAKDRSAFGGFIVAGGSGKRFGALGAKGAYGPVTPLGNESFYDVLIDKNRARAAAHGHSLMYPLCLMVSSETIDDTLSYVRNLPLDVRRRIIIPRQRELPIVKSGTSEAFLKSADRIARGGAGHADAFDYVLKPQAGVNGLVWSEESDGFIEANVVEWYRSFGVKYIQYMNVDNPLTPFGYDYIIGKHALSADRQIELAEKRAHITHIVVEKRSPSENLAFFMRDEKDLRLSLDYRDATDEIMAACRFGGPSIAVVTLDSLEGAESSYWSFDRNKDYERFSDGKAGTIKGDKLEASSLNTPRSSNSVDIGYPLKRSDAPDRDDIFAETKTQEQLKIAKALQSSHWKKLIFMAIPGINIPESTVVQLPWAADYMIPEELARRLSGVNFDGYVQESAGLLVTPDFKTVRTFTFDKDGNPEVDKASYYDERRTRVSWFWYSYRDGVLDLLEGVTPKAPFQIEIHPYHYSQRFPCNNNCGWCTRRRDKLELRKAHDTGIKPNRLISFVRSLKGSGINKVIISGNSTEPLLYPWIGAVIKSIKSSGLGLGLFTNFYHGERVMDTLTRVATEGDLLRISLDAGTEESYRKTHHPVDRAAFSKIIKNVERLLELRRIRKSPLKVDITYLVTEKNSSESELSSVIEWTDRIGVDMIRFSVPLKPTHQNPNYEMAEATADTIKKRIIDVAERYKDRGIKIFIRQDSVNQPEKVFGKCHHGQLIPVIGARGKLYPCTSTSTADFGHLGMEDINSRDFDFWKIWRDQTKWQHDTKHCPDCTRFEYDLNETLWEIFKLTANTTSREERARAVDEYFEDAKRGDEERRLSSSGATELFDIIESVVTSKRAEYMTAANKLIGSLAANTAEESTPGITPIDENMATAGIRESVERAIEAIDKIDQEKVAPETRAAIELLKKNLSQFEADGAVGSLIILARNAKRENQELIIGLETDWMPGSNIKNSFQSQAIAALMKEIGAIGEALESMGLNNVKIVRGSGSQLAGAIMQRADDSHTDMRNIIIMASKDTVYSDSFAIFRNAKEGNRPFLTSIDPKELVEAYEKYGESLSKQLRIKLTALLYMTIEVAQGKKPPEVPWIKYNSVMRMLELELPAAELIDYDALKETYKAEKAVLHAA